MLELFRIKAKKLVHSVHLSTNRQRYKVDMSRIKSLLAIGTLLNGSYDVTEKFTHNRATLIGDTSEMLFDYCLPYNLPFFAIVG